MAKIETIKNTQNTTIYPVTHISAIFTNNGNETLDKVIVNKDNVYTKDEIDSKIIDAYSKDEANSTFVTKDDICSKNEIDQMIQEAENTIVSGDITISFSSNLDYEEIEDE